MSTSYALMDTETLNVVGSFRSRAAALRAVAETVHQYGETSPEAVTLVLFRQDGPPDDAHVAEGEALIRLALTAEAFKPSQKGAMRKARQFRLTTASGKRAG
jgi:hypothetical protein